MRAPRAFLVLRHRDLRLVVFGNLVSQLGTWSQYVGVGWAASQLSDSKVALGVAFAAPWAPSLVFSPVAGVLADRYDRRRLVLLGNLAMAVPPFVVGLLLQRGTATVAWLIALVFVGGAAQALCQPASLALVPELVPEGEVQQAIALNSGMLNLTRIVGPGIGGLAIRWWGVGWAFHLNALSFFAVIIAWWFVRVPTRSVAEVTESVLSRLRNGVAYARAEPAVGRLLVLTTVTSFFVMHAPLMPLFAKDVLHGDAGTYALLASGPGLGSFVGAILVGELVSGRARRRGMTVGALSMGLALVAFASSRSVALSVSCLALFGLAHLVMNTLIMTVVTAAASDEYRGRVLGLLGTANLGLIPLNSLVAGLLASAIGPVWTVAVAGSGFLLFAMAFVAGGHLAPVEAITAARPVAEDDLALDAPGLAVLEPAEGAARRGRG